MNPNRLFSDLLEANHHRGGIKCLRTFRLQSGFFDELQREFRDLIDTQTPFIVQENRSTNWVNPDGNMVLYSLLNTTGKFNDTSTDGRAFTTGKKFHHGDKYPSIAALIKTFPDAYNTRLNGMNPKAQLPPHEEHIIARAKKGFPVSSYFLRARFHLPVITNAKCEMILDDDVYRFEPGIIHFFNHGCIHAALNNGDSMRYHLVWDMLLTKEAVELMFTENEDSLPPFLERIKGDQRILTPVRQEKIAEYAVMGIGSSVYGLLRLGVLGIRPYQFQTWYNSYTYLRHTKFGRIEYAPHPR